MKFYYLLLLLLLAQTTSLIAQGIEPILQNGHSSPITALAASPDGQYLASGGKDNSINVWKISTGQIIRHYEGHSAPITGLSFSGDGKYLISASIDKTEKIWEFIKNPDNKILDKAYELSQVQTVRSGMTTEQELKGKMERELAENYYCLQTYTSHSAAVLSLQVASDFKTFITLGLDNTIRFWDPLKNKSESSISVPEAISIAGSADAGKFFLLEKTGTVSIYKYASGSKTEILPESQQLKRIELSKDKKYLAGTDHQNTLHLWDAGKGSKLPITLSVSNSAFAFIPGTTQLLYFKDRSIRIFDIKLNQEIKKFDVFETPSFMCVSGDGAFLCLSENQDIAFYELETGMQKEHKPGQNYILNDAVLSSDGSFILSIDINKQLLLKTELFSGRLSTVPSGASEKIVLHRNGTVALAYSLNHAALYNTADLSLIRTYAVSGIKTVAFSGDEKIYFLKADGNLAQADFRSEAKNSSIPGAENSTLQDGLFSSLSAEKELSVYDLDAQKTIYSKPETQNPAVAYHAGKSLLASINTKLNLEITDIASGKKIKEIMTGLRAEARQLVFSPDGLYITGYFSDGRMKSFEIATAFETAHRLNGKKLCRDYALRYTPNGKYIFCTSVNNQLLLWNWKEDKDIKILQGKNGSVVFTPDNYYIASGKSAELVAFKKGQEYFTFEQFDLHFNRPDKVLQQLGYVPANLVKAYQQAYNKRLKKLGFKNSLQGIGIHIPTLEIENRKQIPATTSSAKITFNIKAADSDYLLKTVMVSVNGVPMQGTRGMDISDKKVKEYKTEYALELSSGENQIKIWVVNEKGAESYKKNFLIVCNKTISKPNLYLMVLGVSKYKDSKLNLNYAAKDGRDLVSSMLKQSSEYNRIVVDTLFNNAVQATNLTSMKSKLQASNVDDRVLVFFAGHGILDANLDYYLGTFDIDAMNPSLKGLPYESLEDLLDGIPARNKVLMMDACHSGEVDKEESKAVIIETEKNDEELNFRSVGQVNVTIGLENSFELMKQLFSDLRKNNGTTVISSAGGAEYAIEGKAWNNGVFTYSLIRALSEKKADRNNDGNIMLSEVQYFVQDEVFSLTKGKQKPTSRVENVNNDWVIWK